MKRKLEDWQKLELERYDTSYRRFKPLPPPSPRHVCQPKIVEKIVTEFVMPETMKQMFFLAGRFSAGDRSRKACEAYRELERMGWL
jgi:hypothetical protein